MHLQISKPKSKRRAIIGSLPLWFEFVWNSKRNESSLDINLGNHMHMLTHTPSITEWKHVRRRSDSVSTPMMSQPFVLVQYRCAR